MKKAISFLMMFVGALTVLWLAGPLAKLAVKPEAMDSVTITNDDYSYVAIETNQAGIADQDTATGHKLFLPIITNPGPSPKKGVGAPFTTPSCEDAATLKTSWYYNWAIFPDGGCPADERFVPRIWGKANVTADQLATAVANAQESGWIIGFNEPNLPGLGFITPEEGATLWKQIENAALPQGIKLVSPAPNPYEPGHASGDIYGYTWLRAMVNAYKAQNNGVLPTFHAIGWHQYYHDPGVIKSYLQARYNDFKTDFPDAKIWVLEYNGCFVQQAPERVMEDLTPWMEQQDWIARYAWYTSRPDANPHSESPCTLIDRSGNLKSLGQLYQSLALE